MAYAILPSEGRAILEAARALRAIKERCQSASYPSVTSDDLDLMEHPTPGQVLSTIRKHTSQVRDNARVTEAASIAEDVLFNLVNITHVHLECETATQVVAHWHTKNMDVNDLIKRPSPSAA